MPWLWCKFCVHTVKDWNVWDSRSCDDGEVGSNTNILSNVLMVNNNVKT